MTPPSTIDQALLRAYRETHYIVDGTPPLVLRVDVFEPALAALHAQHGCTCSAFITACNPYSEATGPARNAQRQATLVAELHALGLRTLDGCGRHPHNDWPAEASVLALGATLAVARSLAVRHEQNAFVWSGPEAIPRLVLLR